MKNPAVNQHLGRFAAAPAWACLFRASDAGLPHHGSPAHDLNLHKFLQAFDGRVVHRQETKLDDLILDVGQRQNGVQFAMQTRHDGRGVPTGATSICQAAASNPGTPASAIGGMCS